MQASSGLQFLVWLVVMLLGGLVGWLGFTAMPALGVLLWFLTFVGAGMLASAVRLTSEWQRAIVLRLGKNRNLPAGFRCPKSDRAILG